MRTVHKIFLGMSDHKRKSVIDCIVNVQGLKSPRTKAAKDYDKVRGTTPLQGEQNLKPALFEHVVKQFINQ